MITQFAAQPCVGVTRWGARWERDVEVARSRQPLWVPHGTVSVSERPEPADDSARRPRPLTLSLLPAARCRVTRAGVPLGPLADARGSVGFPRGASLPCRTPVLVGLHRSRLRVSPPIRKNPRETEPVTYYIRVHHRGQVESAGGLRERESRTDYGVLAGFVRFLYWTRSPRKRKRWKAAMDHSTRNRVVTFRLSEEEYDALKTACGAEQDSVSAVARRTVLEWAEAVSTQPKVQKRLTEIDEKLDTLLGLIYRDRHLATKAS